jgi:hypothetical protein
LISAEIDGTRIAWVWARQETLEGRKVEAAQSRPGGRQETVLQDSREVHYLQEQGNHDGSKLRGSQSHRKQTKTHPAKQIIGQCDQDGI